MVNMTVTCKFCGATNQKDEQAHSAKCRSCGKTTAYWIGPPRRP